MATRKGYNSADSKSGAFGSGHIRGASITMTEAGTLASVGGLFSYQGGSNPQIRFAVYQGGTTSDPTGATLVYDSGSLTGSTSGDQVIEKTGASGSLSAGVVWIFAKHAYEVSANSSVSTYKSGTSGDIVNGQAYYYTGSANANNEAGVSFTTYPGATLGAETGTSASEAPLLFITYDAGASGVAVPILMSHYQ